MATYRLTAEKAPGSRRYSVAFVLTRDGLDKTAATLNGYLGANSGHDALLFSFTPQTRHVPASDITHELRVYDIDTPQEGYRLLCGFLLPDAREDYLRGPFRDALAQIFGVDKSRLVWERGSTAVDEFLASLPAPY